MLLSVPKFYFLVVNSDNGGSSDSSWNLKENQMADSVPTVQKEVSDISSSPSPIAYFAVWAESSEHTISVLGSCFCTIWTQNSESQHRHQQDLLFLCPCLCLVYTLYFILMSFLAKYLVLSSISRFIRLPCALLLWPWTLDVWAYSHSPQCSRHQSRVPKGSSFFWW